jgi:hypothetical protein
MCIFVVMKTQLDNLIRFSFNLHNNMDVDLIDIDPTYIMEKWEKIYWCNT